MAWAPDYCTAAELKSWLRIGDAADDALLAFAITAASRAIDAHCGRQFGQLTAAVTRYYTWDGVTHDGRSLLVTDDLYTTATLTISVDTAGDGLTPVALAAADYDLWPANAAADAVPWKGFLLRKASAAPFSRYARGIEVAARWGWASVPIDVVQATLMQAARLFARRNAPFGVAGSPELGSEMRLLAKLDPDVAAGLSHLRRPWAAA